MVSSSPESPGTEPSLLSALTMPRSRAIAQRLGRLVWPHRRLLGIWLGAYVATQMYALLRGYADNAGAPAHSAEVETWLFGTLPSEQLQRLLLDRWATPLEWTFVVIHAAWFFLPWLALGLISFKRREKAGSFVLWWLVLQASVLPMFLLFPLQPPWMADSDVTRVLANRLGEIRDANQLAAMPSLHVAWPLVMALWFAAQRWRGPAAFFFGYTALVSFEVVASGEHYVVDVLGAVAAAAFAVVVARAVEARSRSWRRNPAATAVGAVPQLAPARVALERGQTLLEFSLLAPFILVFVYAIVMFGIGMNARASLQQAVREGARQASVGKSDAEVQTLAAGNAQEFIDEGDIVICHPMNGTSQGKIGDPVKVSTSYDFELVQASGILGGLWGIGDLTITMAPSATARLEKTVLSPTDC